MIPKIIHYCWFGHNKKSLLIENCLRSWKKYCPDYHIIEWNEENFDVNCNEYVSQAYNDKKWAFVSDYCRMSVLYKYGGIYLDTDVELLKSIDELLENGIASFENNRKGFVINPGVIFACEPKDIICKEILDTFIANKYIMENGTRNNTTICERATSVFLNHGLKLNNTNQIVEKYVVFNTEYFNPYDMEMDQVNKTENTISIHWFNASWFSESQKLRINIYKKINKLIGFNIIKKFKNIINYNK